MANKNLQSLTFSSLTDTYLVRNIPAGGTSDQVLTKNSNTDYDLKWSTPSAGVSPYTSNPAALGVASPGSSANFARGDHVHPKPSASDIGAIAAPSSHTSGQFLMWNGSTWIASSLPVWDGSVT